MCRTTSNPLGVTDGLQIEMTVIRNLMDEFGRMPEGSLNEIGVSGGHAPRRNRRRPPLDRVDPASVVAVELEVRIQADGFVRGL